MSTVTVSGQDITCTQIYDLGERHAHTASDCTHGEKHPESTIRFWREALPHRPATWEGSVRQALRAAVDQNRELRGCALASHGVNAETGAIEAEIGAGLPWATKGQIDRGSAEEVAAGCRGLVAVALVAFRRDRVKLTDCPVCLGVAGWLPACEAHRPSTTEVKPQESAPVAAHAAGPMAPEGYRFRIDSDGDVEVVGPTGAIWHYFACDTHDDNSNGDLWLPHEERVRQYAASLIGETAPPIRPETICPEDPRHPSALRAQICDAAL